MPCRALRLQLLLRAAAAAAAAAITNTHCPPPSPGPTPLPCTWLQRAAQKGKEPLPPPDRYFRTQICSKWREGTCRNGAACTFAHGEEALRRPPPLPPSTSAAGRWEPVSLQLHIPALLSPLSAVRLWVSRDCSVAAEVIQADNRPLQHVRLAVAGNRQPCTHAPCLQRRPPSSPRCEPEAEAEGQQQAAQRPRPPHLCKFWAERGNCRFGDDCRYEHTPSERGSRMQEVGAAPRFAAGCRR